MLRRFRTFQRRIVVSVGQTAAKLRAVKLGCLKKILPLGQSRTTRGQPGFDSKSMKAYVVESSFFFSSFNLSMPLERPYSNALSCKALPGVPLCLYLKKV